MTLLPVAGPSRVARKLWHGPSRRERRSPQRGRHADRIGGGRNGHNDPKASRARKCRSTPSATLPMVVRFPQLHGEYLGEPTAITNQNMKFDKASFERLNAYSALLRSDRSRPLRFRETWRQTDHMAGLVRTPGVSTTTFRPQLCQCRSRRHWARTQADKLLALYMLPGVYHCNLYGGHDHVHRKTSSRRSCPGSRTARRRTRKSLSNMRRARTARSRPRAGHVYPLSRRRLAAYSGSGDPNADRFLCAEAEPKQAFRRSTDMASASIITSLAISRCLGARQKDEAVVCAAR